MSDRHTASDLSQNNEDLDQISPEIKDIGPDQETSFMLETSLQVQDAALMLGEIVELKPSVWGALDASKRLEVLQGVEDKMATIQSRPSVEVRSVEMESGSFGYFDGKCIAVNAGDLAGDQMQVGEYVDTIVHEGRHAYQQYAIENPGFVSNPAVVNSWAENTQPSNYLNAEEYGQEAYFSQPVEADAWDYANQITSAL